VAFTSEVEELHDELRSLASACCFLLFAAALAFPQSRNTGEIRGTVSAAGAVVAGRHRYPRQRRHWRDEGFVTNQDGIYDTVSTPAGNYKISFTAKGFKKLVRGPITLQVDVITENASLDVGSMNGTITVTGRRRAAPGDRNRPAGCHYGFQKHFRAAPVGAGSPAQTGLLSTSIWRALQALQTGGSRRPGAPGMPATRFPSTATCRTSATSFRDGASTLLPASYNNDDEILEPFRRFRSTLFLLGAIRHGRRHVQPDQQEWNQRLAWSGYEFFSQNFLNANGYFNNQAPKLITTP